MRNGKKNKFLSLSGFSLLEVMMSLTIFAGFTTAYIVSEGYNVTDSSLMKNELLLNTLCKRKIDEIRLDPPKFEESLTLTPEKGNFEEEGFPQIEFSIEYKRLSIPDLGKIQGKEDDGGDEGGGEQLKSRIFEGLKKNLENMIWQVSVTVNEKGTTFPVIMSTFLTDVDAKIEMKF